ncbi:MAG: SDR family oxidoreductase [Bacteroidia bacterium]
MKRILITGSNGLLGQKIVYRCIGRSDLQLIATARGENRLIEKQGYTYMPMDIGNREEVIRIISEHKPQVVIHTAAMTNVDACETDREGCLRNNVHAVEYIVEACNLANVHLVHVSTDFIFDGENGPYDEEAEANPVSYYGWSKAEAERIVMERSTSWAILRTILVFGVVDNMSRSNVVLWAKSALEKGAPIKVVDDQFRMPTLAEDLADGCLLAATQNAQGIFNISGPDYMSIFELVNRVADFFHLDKSIVQRSDSASLNQPAKRPPRTGFDLSKSRRILGYNPHSFEEGLAILQHQLEKQS